MFLFYVNDVDASMSVEPFLAKNEAVMMRTVYLKYKDFPFKDSLFIRTLGVWDEDKNFNPLVTYDKYYEQCEKNGYEVVVKASYNVSDIVKHVAELLNEGSMDPNDRLVSEEVGKDA